MGTESKVSSIMLVIQYMAILYSIVNTGRSKNVDHAITTLFLNHLNQTFNLILIFIIFSF